MKSNNLFNALCAVALLSLVGCSQKSPEPQHGEHGEFRKEHSSYREHGSGSGVEAHRVWIRATPLGAKMGAAYLHLMNYTEEADALLSVSSPLAEAVEIHNSVEQDGMMKMFWVERVGVPAKDMVALKPGGVHVMLIGLKQQPQFGQTHVLMLHFEKAGMVKVEAKVLKGEMALSFRSASMSLIRKGGL